MFSCFFPLAVTDEEKQPFVDAYAEEQLAFDKKMEEYKANNVHKPAEEKKEVKKVINNVIPRKRAKIEGYVYRCESCLEYFISSSSTFQICLCETCTSTSSMVKIDSKEVEPGQMISKNIKCKECLCSFEVDPASSAERCNTCVRKASSYPSYHKSLSVTTSSRDEDVSPCFNSESHQRLGLADSCEDCLNFNEVVKIDL
jgi:hypothetical protein